MASRRGNGEGSIFQREDGRWVATVELGMRPNAAGVLARKRKVLYGRTRREVQQKLREAQQALAAGELATSPRQTLAEYLESWLATKKDKVRPNSYLGYQSTIRVHLVPTLGTVQLAKLTPQQIDAMLRAKRAGGLSAVSVGNIHGLLHNALSQAVAWDLLPRNVAERVARPQVRKAEKLSLAPSEALLFLRAIRGDRWEALYLLALTTGMRLSELLGLRWADVDLVAGVLHVKRQIQHVTGMGMVEDVPKSERSKRSIALVGLNIESLKAHRERQDAERRREPTWHDQGLVFPNLHGRPMQGGHLRDDHYYPLLRRSGLPHVTLHGLRHSFSSLLMALGVHRRIIADVMGHSRTDLTEDTYGHVAAEVQRPALEALEKMLSAAKTGQSATTDDTLAVTLAISGH